MRTEAEQVLCRFQTSTDDRHGGSPMHEWIVERARRLGLQGATVLEGIAGFRSDGRPLARHDWSIVQHLPVIVEVVDGAGQISRLLSEVEPAFHRGTITFERAYVLRYRAGRDRPSPLPDRIPAAPHPGAAAGITTMNVPEAGVLLRVFIGENDREPGGPRPLFEAIVRRAREAQLAGATVLRGPMGFGRHSRMHTTKFLELSSDLPIVIEIVDAEDRIQAFLPTIDDLVTEGLVTIEAVRVLKYTSPDEPRA